MEEILDKIASGNIVFEDEPSAPILANVDEDVRERVKKRIAFITTEGRKHEGIAEGCGPTNIPQWFDPVAFKHAQDLFSTYSAL